MLSRMKALTASNLLIVFLVLVSGCSTVSSRLGGSGRSDFYPATQLSTELVAEPVCWLFFACPIVLISLPVDVALDTLLLPVDAVRARSRQKSKKAESSEPPNVTEPS